MLAWLEDFARLRADRLWHRSRWWKQLSVKLRMLRQRMTAERTVGGSNEQ